MKTGMNCTAWNSVRAKAEASRPKATPITAPRKDSRSRAQGGPVSSIPSGPNSRTTRMLLCSTASRPNTQA